MSNKEANVAEKIWEEIKGVTLNMFALPGQTVDMYLSPFAVEPSKLYLEPKDKNVVNATAVLPALEEALRKKYGVLTVGRFICVYHIGSPVV